MRRRPGLDTAAARAARRRLIRACAETADSDRLLREAIESIRGVVPFKATGWATADPVTLLWTGGVIEGFSPSSWGTFLENELVEPDVNKYRDLLQRPDSTAVLRPEVAIERGSHRFRSMYAPHGLGPELRVAFTADGACWGGACLVRGEEDDPFTPAEASFLAGLRRHLAHGLRRVALGSAEGTSGGGPGVLLLDDELAPLAVNADAERWLRALKAWPCEPETLLVGPVGAVVARARAGVDGADVDRPPRVRVHTEEGWIAVHASAAGTDPRQWSVVLEPARPAEVVPLVAHAHGLTPRERQTLGLLLRGMVDKQIAQELRVSVHTASEYVKRVMAKFGVRSRGELQAKVLAEHYEPSLAAVVPLNEG